MQRVTAFFIWLLLVGFACLAYDVHRFLSTPGSDAPKDIIIAIAPGATFDRAAWDLKKAGAITDVTRFRLLAHYKDALGKVRVGEYQINTGWLPERVLWQITQGQPLLYRLSIREGLTWWETAREVEAQGFARYEDFKEVIHDPGFLREHNIPFTSAEGFLYPETYLRNRPRVLDKAQARDVASSMAMMFWKKTRDLRENLSRKKDASAAPAPDAVAGTGSANATGRLAVSLASEAASMDSSGASRQQRDAFPASAPPAFGNAARPETVTTNASAPEAAPASPTAALAAAPHEVQASGAAGAPHEVQASGAAAAPSTPALDQADPLIARDMDPAALRRWVILASLVEKETAIPAERARVAGVYANRLRIGMLLQCDPTIIYGVGESFSGSILKSQLADAKNSYNTYMHAGLPPGPICSPGLEAIKAAAAPESHDFFYFVATGVDGGHSFSKNLTDHNKARELYRSRVREGQ